MNANPESFDELISPENLEVEAVTPAPKSSDPKKPKGRSGRIVAIVAASAVLLAGGAYATVNYIDSQTKIAAEKKKVEKAKKEEEIKLAKIKAADNPLGVLLEGSPTMAPGKVTASVAEGAIKLTDGTVFTVPNSNPAGALNPCTVAAQTDICYVGSLTLNGRPGAAYMIHDASTTRVLENPKSFGEVKRSDGAVSARANIDISGKEKKFGVITRGGNLGLLLMFDPSVSDSELEKTLSSVSISD